MTTQEIFEKRGYIVIQSDVEQPLGSLPPGSFMTSGHRYCDAVTVVVAETDYADWLVQKSMLGEEEALQRAHYYRVIAE